HGHAMPPFGPWNALPGIACYVTGRTPHFAIARPNARGLWMQRLLKRIALNGAIAAGLLAVVGFGMAELAGMWLATEPTGNRSPPAAVSADPLQAQLRHRLPRTLAMWGFVFVVLTEVVLFLWRGDPVKSKPDPAEQLLEELLAQADAAQARGQE